MVKKNRFYKTLIIAVLVMITDHALEVISGTNGLRYWDIGKSDICANRPLAQ